VSIISSPGDSRYARIRLLELYVAQWSIFPKQEEEIHSKPPKKKPTNAQASDKKNLVRFGFDRDALEELKIRPLPPQIITWDA
jgi:hypothetical protein